MPLIQVYINCVIIINKLKCIIHVIKLPHFQFYYLCNDDYLLRFLFTVKEILKLS